MTNEKKQSKVRDLSKERAAIGDAPSASGGQQLGLSIVPKLAYQASDFVLHSGVSELHASLVRFLLEDHYPVISIIGESRAGKTHYSEFLHDMLSEKLSGKECSLRFFEGSEFQEALLAGELESVRDEQTVLLVDDADLMLKQHGSGEASGSGPLVKLIEDLRVLKGSVILFRSLPLDDYGFDEHLMSRFKAGSDFTLGDPDRDEAKQLLEALALQRGFRLKERHLGFLEKRMSTSIREMEAYLDRVQMLSRIRSDKVDYSMLDDAL